MRAVDWADVVQTEKAALEQVVPLAVLSVNPPGEVDQQLVEDPADEIDIPAAVDCEYLQGRPRLHWRVDIAESPLVRRQRPIRMLEPLPAEQDQLILGERRVHMRQRDAMECEVPCGKPGVLPLVRHRHDVERVEIPPLRVASAESLVRRPRLRWVA